MTDMEEQIEYAYHFTEYLAIAYEGKEPPPEGIAAAHEYARGMVFKASGKSMLQGDLSIPLNRAGGRL